MFKCLNSSEQHGYACNRSVCNKVMKKFYNMASYNPHEVLHISSFMMMIINFMVYNM